MVVQLTRTFAEFETYLAENRMNMVIITCQTDASEDTTSGMILRAEILKDTDAEVKPVDSSQFPAKAKRPLNSQ